MDQNTNNNFWDQPQPTTPVSSSTISQDDEAFKVLENMSDEEFLKTFATGLLVEKNLGEMDKETKTEMVHDLVERMTTFINRMVLEALPSDKLETVNQLANNGSLEEINKVIQESGIDTNQITANALEKFRNIYLGSNENAEA